MILQLHIIPLLYNQVLNKIKIVVTILSRKGRVYKYDESMINV